MLMITDDKQVNFLSVDGIEVSLGPLHQTDAGQFEIVPTPAFWSEWRDAPDRLRAVGVYCKRDIRAYRGWRVFMSPNNSAVWQDNEADTMRPRDMSGTLAIDPPQELNHYEQWLAAQDGNEFFDAVDGELAGHLPVNYLADTLQECGFKRWRLTPGEAAVVIHSLRNIRDANGFSRGTQMLNSVCDSLDVTALDPKWEVIYLTLMDKIYKMSDKRSDEILTAAERFWMAAPHTNVPAELQMAGII